MKKLIITLLILLIATSTYATLSPTAHTKYKDWFHKEEITVEENIKDGGITYKYVIRNDPTSKGDEKYTCFGKCD